MPSSNGTASITQEQLLTATDRYLTSFACNKTHPLSLLSYFSTTSPVTIQHYPASCTHPQSSLLRGHNAIRSYFDLLATHWTRSSVQHRNMRADATARTVVFDGDVTWTWKKSGRTWVEVFVCTLSFDDALKIVSFIMKTESPDKTCVMRAKDVDDSPMTVIMAAANEAVLLSR